MTLCEYLEGTISILPDLKWIISSVFFYVASWDLIFSYMHMAIFPRFIQSRIEKDQSHNPYLRDGSSLDAPTKPVC